MSCQLKGIKWRTIGTVQQYSRLSQGNESFVCGMTVNLFNVDFSTGLMLGVLVRFTVKL